MKLIIGLLVFNGLFALFIQSISELLLPLSFFVLIISLLCLAPFIDTPSLVKAEKLFYLSPMLLMEQEKKGKVKLHGGTLLEYYFYIKNDWSPHTRRKFVLAGFVSGLLKLIENNQQRQNADLTIEFTSYILNRSTMRHYGFKRTGTSTLQWIILCFNIVPLTVANSMINKRLKLPRLSHISSYTITAKELEKHRDRLSALDKRF